MKILTAAVLMLSSPFSKGGQGDLRLLAAMLLILTLPLSAYGAPYLVSSPSADAVESCVLDGAALSCELAADGSIRADLAALPAGSYTVKAKYCTGKGLWCSDWSDPFSFIKPTLTPPAPISLSR